MAGQIGNKGGGRQTDAEIVRKYINMGLANKIANEELKKISDKKGRSLDEMKALVMPIVLKGITDKSQVKHNIVLPIYGGVSQHDSNKKDIPTDKED